MSFFFDSNVLAYCTDTTEPVRQALARKLVGQHSLAGNAIVSTQVLVELFATLTRQQQMDAAAAKNLIQAYAAWPVIDSDMMLVSAALETSATLDVSIFDAMVIEAALKAKARTLYSETLRHGQRVGSLVIQNPFV